MRGDRFFYRITIQLVHQTAPAMSPQRYIIGRKAWIGVAVFILADGLELGQQRLDLGTLFDQAAIKAVITGQMRGTHATVLLDMPDQLEQAIAGLNCNTRNFNLAILLAAATAQE